MSRSTGARHPKKSLVHFRPQRTLELYPVIQQLDNLNVATVCELCRVLGVGRSGYYVWLSDKSSSRAKEDKTLSAEVKEIFWSHRRRYGARRIAQELRDRGYPCGRKRTSRLMKQQGFLAIQPKSFKPRSTESRHRLGYNENLLIQQEITKVRQAWVGDITYIPCIEVRFCYLAVLMDLRSRRIVGWQLQDDMKEELTLATLKNAIVACQPPVGLIHHTDRGGQYAGRRYRAVLSRAQIRQSMSRADNCYDNAFMESCFGTIKNELEMTEYKTVSEAHKEIQSYITYYNHERKHSALNYQSPAQFEATQGN